MITGFYENSAKGLEVEMDKHACTHTPVHMNALI